MSKPIKYGNAKSFWVEYPSGLIDVSRTQHPGQQCDPLTLLSSQLGIAVDGDSVIRVNKMAVIIDMQKYPYFTIHTCLGILWVNWDLSTDSKQSRPHVRFYEREIGSELPGNFGRLVMRGAYNSDLYELLQAEYEKGEGHRK